MYIIRVFCVARNRSFLILNSKPKSKDNIYSEIQDNSNTYFCLIFSIMIPFILRIKIFVITKHQQIDDIEK